MNDAHSRRHDAAGGPGRGRRPEDQYDPYDPVAQQDPYGGQYQQPGPYGQDPYGGGQYQQQADPYGQDPYAGGQYQQQDGYGYDPYGAQQQATGYVPQQQGYQESDGGRYDTGRYDTGQYDTGTYDTGEYRTGEYDTGQFATGQYATGQFTTADYDTGQYPAYPQDPGYAPPPEQARGTQQPRVPGQQRPPSDNPYDELGELDDEAGRDDLQEARRAAGDYRTEQFSFVDDEEESEEVIDWLKFAETRTERRDERKRRGRHRIVALFVVLALALVGGVGYLWQQNKLPFLGGEEKAAAQSAAQKRDVIVVHLKELDGGNSSTALLVNNETSDKGTTVLLPNTMAVGTDDGSSTTLGKSVDTAGAGPTRDGLSALLGADIKGTWRLDTPFLELLVESVGGIQVDTDTEVKGTGKDKGKTIVKKGEKQRLNGVAAVAYATHQAPGEAADKQLVRFGKVLESVLKKLPSTADAATKTVQSLGQVADPSLPEGELGASLAPLAEQAKTGRYKTVTLPVQADGTLDEETGQSMVKSVLGGTVKNTDPDATPNVRVQNATGRADASGEAQVALVNSGYTFVSGGKAKAVAAKSTVEYSGQGQAKFAQEVAQTLGLPKSAVKKASGDGQSAQIRVVLGQDFKG